MERLVFGSNAPGSRPAQKPPELRGMLFRGQPRIDFEVVRQVYGVEVAACLQRGEELFQGRQFAQAESVFLSALKEAPKIQNASNRLGLCYILEGQFEKAISLFEQLVQGEPKNPLYWGNLGYAKSSQARQGHMLGRDVESCFLEAFDCYEKAFRLDPSNMQYALEMVGLLISSGMYDSALSLVRVVLESPHTKKDDHVVASLQCVEIYARQGDLTNVNQVSQRMKETLPDDLFTREYVATQLIAIAAILALKEPVPYVSFNVAEVAFMYASGVLVVRDGFFKMEALRNASHEWNRYVNDSRIIEPLRSPGRMQTVLYRHGLSPSEWAKVIPPELKQQYGLLVINRSVNVIRDHYSGVYKMGKDFFTYLLSEDGPGSETKVEVFVMQGWAVGVGCAVAGFIIGKWVGAIIGAVVGLYSGIATASRVP